MISDTERIKIPSLGTANILQAVLDNITDRVVIFDKEHKVICFNDLAKTTLKLIHKKEIKVGDDYRGFIIEENMPLYLESFDRTMNHEVVCIEKEIKVDDRKVWFQLKFNPVYDDLNSLFGITFTITDIDLRKSKELSLLQSEANFRQIFEQATEAIFLHDFKGNFIDFNDSLCKMLGYTREELTSMDVPGILDPEQFETQPLLIDRVANGEHIFSRRLMVNKQGEKLDVDANVKKFGPDMILVIARDVTDKRKTQKQIELSEARFRGAFEFAAIGMALVSLDGQWLKVNKELCHMIGYTEQELLLLSFQKITHPEDVENDLNYLQQLVKGEKELYRKEKRYIHKNGAVVWVNLSVSVIKDSDGLPQYFVSQIENITEKIESQLKFKNLVEKSLVGVYILQNGRFAYVNPHIAVESGYTEEELTSMPVGQFIYKDDLEIVHEHIQERLRGGMESARYEIRGVKKDGQVIWLEMFGTTTIYQGAPAIIGTAVNITEKKAVYSELIKSEASLRSIFDTTQISYFLLDENFNIVAFNQHFLKSYHEQTGFVIQTGANMIDLTLPDKRENVTKIFQTIMTNSTPVTYESSYTNRDTFKCLSITVSPVISNSKVIGLCVTGYDITNTKNLEIERKEMIGDLVKRNKDLQEFAQIVSHNLRGPLATILGLTNMLKDAVFVKDTDVIIDGIVLSAEKLDLVVKELNSILNVKSESSESRVTIHLDELIEEIKEKFSIIIQNNAKISYDFSQVGEIFAVRSFIYNIFYNLISNSLKYTDKNRAPDIRIRTEKNIDGVLIAISDNGVGIDMEKYGDHIFSLNKRFHNSEDGKGLGLFMVKAQVDVLNGTVEIDSEPTKGTTVRIILPR